MNKKGSALMTVIVIVVLVPIVVFATTSFISTSLLRHTVQNRNMKALYLAQAGIHRAIYNITSAGSPGTPLSVPIGSDTIDVTLVNGDCPGIYQLASTGTSVQSTYPTQIKRTVFAQYEASSKKVSIFQEGDGTGVPVPACCDTIWWPFSENSGYTTGTAPYVGTLTPSTVNGPSWVAGRVGTALRFNQSTTHNYVLVPDNAGLDLTTQGTIMAWVYPTATSASGTGIVRRGSATSASAQEAYGLLVVSSGKNRRFRFMLRESSGGTQRTVTGNTNIAINNWYHVAGSWGPNGIRIYVNGAVQGSNATVRSSYNTTSPLHIGTLRTNSATTRFFGVIDEVYLYACQKTPEEIVAYYDATKP